MSGWRLVQQPLAHRAAPTQTGEVGFGPRFIQKNQVIWIYLLQLLLPLRPRLGDIGPVLFTGVEGL